MLEYFPAIERAFYDSKSKAALTLLSGYQAPESLRRIGLTRLKARGARNSVSVAQLANDAVHSQRSTLPAQTVGARLVAGLAAEITAIDKELEQTGIEIADHYDSIGAPRFSPAHPDSVRF